MNNYSICKCDFPILVWSNCLLVPMFFYLWYLKVAWNRRKIFVLMVNCTLNIAHPVLWFNVIQSKKPWGSNVTHVPCYLGIWVQFHNRSFEHHKHWFCPNDLNHCVNGTTRKYVRLSVLELYGISKKILI